MLTLLSEDKKKDNQLIYMNGIIPSYSKEKA